MAVPSKTPRLLLVPTNPKCRCTLLQHSDRKSCCKMDYHLLSRAPGGSDISGTRSELDLQSLQYQTMSRRQHFDRQWYERSAIFCTVPIEALNQSGEENQILDSPIFKDYEDERFIFITGLRGSRKCCGQEPPQDVCISKRLMMKLLW